jgi:hypothetical protein
MKNPPTGRGFNRLSWPRTADAVAARESNERRDDFFEDVRLVEAKKEQAYQQEGGNSQPRANSLR